MTRFRPNLVVDGAPAWAEDDWVGRRLRIGDRMFRAAGPCDRCVVTTTDQETGVRTKEPLRTLGRHRNVKQKLLFGLNLVPIDSGPLAVQPRSSSRPDGRPTSNRNATVTVRRCCLSFGLARLSDPHPGPAASPS